MNAQLLKCVESLSHHHIRFVCLLEDMRRGAYAAPRSLSSQTPHQSNVPAPGPTPLRPAQTQAPMSADEKERQQLERALQLSRETSEVPPPPPRPLGSNHRPNDTRHTCTAALVPRVWCSRAHTEAGLRSGSNGGRTSGSNCGKWRTRRRN